MILTVIHLVRVVEGEGDGETTEQEDGSSDATHYNALSSGTTVISGTD